MITKSIKTLAVCTLALLCAACGGGDSEPAAPKTYTLDPITLSHTASSRTVSMPSGFADIDNVQNAAVWLTVTPQTGAVLLSWTENTITAERKANVTITSTTGEKVFISITQEGRPTDESDITHGDITDQPAYLPYR